MINKNKYILSLTLMCFCIIASLSACKKYAGDSYSFSDTTKHYMIFSASSLTFNDGIDDKGTDNESDDVYKLTPKNISLSTRVGFVDPIQVSYSIAITGGTSQTLNYTYPSFSTSKTIATTLDASKFPAGVNVITGTITLNSAVGDKYGSLVIGYPSPNAGVVIKFKAYRPGSPVQ